MKEQKNQHEPVALRNRLQEVWTNRWAGVVLTTIFVITAAFLFHWIPSPGVSAGVMAIVSVVVSLRTKATGTEKAVWTLLIVTFLVIELGAIRKDRLLAAVEQERRIDEERKHFSDLMLNMKSGFEDTTRAETGGDSYCHLESPSPTASVLVVCNGKYPVYDLEFWVSDASNKASQWDEKVGNMAANTFKGLPKSLPFSGADKQNFTVLFSARNGFSTELMRFRKVGDMWVSTKLVYRPPNSQYPKGLVLMRSADKAFPMDELKQDDEWAWAEKLPNLEDVKKP